MKITRIPSGFRLPNNFAPHAPLLRTNSYSPLPSQTPPIQQSAQSPRHQPLAFDHIEALAACTFKGDPDPDCERMLAIQSLRKAAKKIQKKSFGPSITPNYIYLNNRGAAILSEIVAFRAETKEQVKQAEEKVELAQETAKQAEERGKQAEEKANQAEEKANQAEEKAKQVDERNEELRTELSRITEWTATVQPMQKIALAIRLRFFHNFRKSIGEGSGEGIHVIRKGNMIAHNGDFLTDIAFMRRGDIKDTGTFFKLYGIAYDKTQPYTMSGTIVAMTNKRATMLANPRRFSKQWDEGLQSDFDHVLSHFNKASKDEWKKFEVDETCAGPEREAWSRITQAYQGAVVLAGRRNSWGGGKYVGEVGGRNAWRR